jgi:hypothetical protein
VGWTGRDTLLPSLTLFSFPSCFLPSPALFFFLPPLFSFPRTLFPGLSIPCPLSQWNPSKPPYKCLCKINPIHNLACSYVSSAVHNIRGKSPVMSKYLVWFLRVWYIYWWIQYTRVSSILWFTIQVLPVLLDEEYWSFQYFVLYNTSITSIVGWRILEFPVLCALQY